MRFLERESSVWYFLFLFFVGTEEDDSGLHLAEERACELISLRYSIVGWAGAVNSPYFPARYYCGLILISMQHVSVKKKGNFDVRFLWDGEFWCFEDVKLLTERVLIVMFVV